MNTRRVAATTLAGTLCALAIIGGSQVQGASGSSQAPRSLTPIYQNPSYRSGNARRTSCRG